MNKIKKFGALFLALVMILALSVPALATEFNTGDNTSAGQAKGVGEVGGFTSDNKDTPRVLTKQIKIQKEITAFNPDETLIYGPAITYTYVISAAADNELVSVTDATTDHTSGIATVFNPVLAGVGSPVLTGQDNDGTNTNQIRWLNTDILAADTVANKGVANIKNLTVDFSNVVFTGPGIYRYKITESATYDNTGVTDGSISAVRYLDVYVKRSDSFDPSHDGTTGKEFVAGDWSIYGYVCISPESVTSNAGGTTAVTPSTKKTNGFVTEENYTADQYYTYNFTVTKDLVNDNTMVNHQFPLTVAFSNGPTGTFQLIAKKNDPSTLNTTGNTAGKTVNGVDVSANTLQMVGSAVGLANFNNAGNPKVGDGNATAEQTTGYIKYIGIPFGFTVAVTEQNDVVGTTYTASVKEDVTTVAGTSLTGVGVSEVSDGATKTNANPVTASLPYQGKITRTAAYSNAATSASDKNAAVQITNNLSIISPTGVVLRVAPYVLMLAAGVVLLVLSRKRKKAADAA